MEELVNEINTNQPEVEIAYQLLKISGQSAKFRELMQQVLTLKGLPLDNPLVMASVHTQINLDSRFTFLGQGTWGLKEWAQNKIVRRPLNHGAATSNTAGRRRTLTDELEYEDGEYLEKNENSNLEEEDEWED